MDIRHNATNRYHWYDWFNYLGERRVKGNGFGTNVIKDCTQNIQTYWFIIDYYST